MEQIYERLKESAFQVGQYKKELIGKQGRAVWERFLSAIIETNCKL